MKQLKTKDDRVLITLHRQPVTKFEALLNADLKELTEWPTPASIGPMYAYLKENSESRAKSQPSWRGIPTRVELEDSEVGVQRFQLISEHMITRANGRIVERIEEDVFATVELNPEVLGMTPNYFRAARQ